MILYSLPAADYVKENNEDPDMQNEVSSEAETGEVSQDPSVVLEGSELSMFNKLGGSELLSSAESGDR